MVPLTSAHFVNIGALMRQPHLALTPDMLMKSDGSGLFLRGTVGMLIGMPEVGKSWLTIELVRQVVSKGETAVVLDWEGPAWRFANRLTNLGATPAHGDLVHHYTSASISLDVLADEVLQYEPALVVIDSAAKLYADHDLDENSARDSLTLFSSLARPLSNAGALVVIVDHVVKVAEDRGKWPRGSSAKLGDVDVAYTVQVSPSFGKGRSGTGKLTVAKDRDAIIGSVGTTAAVIHFKALGGNGDLRIILDTPRLTKETSPEEANLSPACRRVLTILKGTTGPLGKEELRQAIANDGSGRGGLADRTILDAARTLVERGLVKREDDGPGTAARWSYIRNIPNEEPQDLDKENAA